MGYGEVEIASLREAGAFSKKPQKGAEYHPLRGEAV
jgi:hypothetical protein